MKLRFNFLFAALAVLAFAAAAFGAFDVAAAVFTVDPITGVLMAVPLAAVDAEKIEFHLKRIQNEVETFTAGASARIQHVEQVVAGAAAYASHHIGGPSVGASALEKLSENDQFTAAAEAAQRGMKPSQFAVRASVDGSIRAALTNDGKGASGDGEIASQADRRGIVGPVARQLRLLDVLPSRPTTSDAVEFVQLSVTGDASEQDQEGDEKATLDFEGTPARAEIVTIAGWTSASKQVLADHAALQAQIDRVIRAKVLSRLEHQLINGDGTMGKINGLLNQGTIFVPTIGATPADIIGEALVTQADYGYQPSLVLLNPFDWYRVQITKTATEGEYIFGSPTMPVAPSLWSTAIVVTPSVPEGTGLTVDTSFATVLDREQLVVTLSNTHADYFVRNLVAILGELRAGLELLDTRAVYKFDLNASE